MQTTHITLKITSEVHLFWKVKLCGKKTPGNWIIRLHTNRTCFFMWHTLKLALKVSPKITGSALTEGLLTSLIGIFLKIAKTMLFHIASSRKGGIFTRKVHVLCGFHSIIYSSKKSIKQLFPEFFIRLKIVNTVNYKMV